MGSAREAEACSRGIRYGGCRMKIFNSHGMGRTAESGSPLQVLGTVVSRYGVG